jgi:hypothetical protein
VDDDKGNDGEDDNNGGDDGEGGEEEDEGNDEEDDVDDDKGGKVPPSQKVQDVWDIGGDAVFGGEGDLAFSA